MKIKNFVVRVKNAFMRGESIENGKEKWNTLASGNARYVVYSKEGLNITEKEFRKVGQEDFDTLVKNDVYLQKVLQPWEEKKVLEIGCGLGRLTEFIGGNFQHVTGVDISDEMIAQAKVRLAGKENIHFVATDGMHYPFPESNFDFIFSYIVFQHMPDAQVVKKNIEEIGRVLKPGGVAKIQLRGVPTEKTNWFYGPSFTQKDLPQLIGDTSLSVIKTEGEGTKYFWVWLEKRQA